MGFSRSVINAGLVELEKLGFVDVQPRQGVYVCDYRRKGSVETLVAIMRYHGGALRQNEVRSLMEVREALECLCLRQVIEKVSLTELEALAPMLDAIRQAASDEEAAERVYTFHHELAVLSGNVLMPLLYNSFHPQGVYLWAMYCKRAGIESLYQIKLRLYTALLNRDLDSAMEQTHSIMNAAIGDLTFYGV